MTAAQFGQCCVVALVQDYGQRGTGQSSDLGMALFARSCRSLFFPFCSPARRVGSKMMNCSRRRAEAKQRWRERSAKESNFPCHF